MVLGRQLLLLLAVILVIDTFVIIYSCRRFVSRGSGFRKAQEHVDKHMDDSTSVSRAQGCLFGQYIGDALGTRYEFGSQSTVESMIREDQGRKGFLPILGGGPFRLGKGSVTDDTELAMALAASLLKRGFYDHKAVASAYRYWLDSEPFDKGNTTWRALQVPKGVKDDSDVLQTIMRQAGEENSTSLSNGCLMRISPLAIAGAFWPTNDLAHLSKLDAQLTNPHPDAQIAVASYTAAVSELIRSGCTKKAFQAALEVSAESVLVTGFLRAAERGDATVLLQNGRGAVHDGTHMGYIGIAFQWAFDEMLHADSFEKGLVRVISRGGDTDTNGCICGAMLGARFGVDAIPGEWKETVKECKQHRVDTYPWVDSSRLLEVAQELLSLSASGGNTTTSNSHPAEKSST